MINVTGLGKLGYPMANFLAKSRFKINCFDKNKEIKLILKKKKNSYLKFEKGLIRNNKNLYIYNNHLDSLKNTKISFITVPTPSKKNGQFEIKNILQVLNLVSVYLKKFYKNKKPYIININSTINPGDIKKFIKFLEQKGLKNKKNFVFLYNPYFVALGEVYKNLMNPNFILIGFSETYSKEYLKKIYNQIYKKPKYKFLTINEAELTKILLNCFVTTKISFTNFVDNICNKFKLKDSTKILDTISTDKRVGPEYFKKGGPYSGPCFPRDNRALINFCKKIDVDYKIPLATHNTNKLTVKKYLQKLNRIKNIKSIGFIGVSYKSNTDCIDESISIKLMNRALRKGYKVSYYDKYTILKNKNYNKIENLKKIINNSDLIFLGYKDKEFKKINNIKKKIYVWDPDDLLEKKKNFIFI